MALQDLRKNDMMAHLLDALDAGQSIGHYGRLVFTMVARHFLEPQELVDLLARDPECSDEQARSLVEQVLSRGYSLPRREKIIEFQSQQEFAICPNADDPDACNVYKNLKFPQEVYDHIQEYYQEKTHAQAE